MTFGAGLIAAENWFPGRTLVACQVASDDPSLRGCGELLKPCVWPGSQYHRVTMLSHALTMVGTAPSTSCSLCLTPMLTAHGPRASTEQRSHNGHAWSLADAACPRQDTSGQCSMCPPDQSTSTAMRHRLPLCACTRRGGGGRNSLNRISARGVCSAVHDGGLHPAPCLSNTVGTAMHRAHTFTSGVNPT